MSNDNATAIPASHHDLLLGPHFAAVAVVMPRGDLANNVIAYHWDGELLRFSTLKSRQKHRNLLADPRVTVCIVDPKNAWRYIEIRGRAEISDDTDRSFIDSIAKKYLGKDHYPYDQPGDERVTITVRPTRVRAQYVHADEGSPQDIGVPVEG